MLFNGGSSLKTLPALFRVLLGGPTATENVTAPKRQQCGGPGDQAREGHLCTLSTMFGWGSALRGGAAHGPAAIGEHNPSIILPLLLGLCSQQAFSIF